MRDGAWAVPEAAGLGIEIDEAAAARHPFAPGQVPALEAVLGDHRQLVKPMPYRYRDWFQRCPISDRMMIRPLKNWT
jgi:hypothetical protein